MERTLQTVYLFRDIMLVPKWNDPGKFVAPGYGTTHERVYTAEQLEFLGGQRSEYPLMVPEEIKRGKK